MKKTNPKKRKTEGKSLNGKESVKRQSKKKVATKKKKKVNKGGRPTRYKEEYNEQARKLCLLGFSDVKLAEFFKVSEVTLNAWKKRHPKFLKCLEEGKEMADSEVVDGLYKRAIGYTHDSVHISNFKGDITKTKIKKHYPPDVTAQRIFLASRQPGMWREVKQLEHGGKDGGPIKHEVAPPQELMDKVNDFLDS